MIVTRNWLQEWIDISEISGRKLLDALNSIGLEVDNYKEIRIPAKIVIGYVNSKRKHDGSDHLSICEVDVATQTLQIVCGAKNVESGQFVPVSLVGAELPGGLKIKPTKLRGVESYGMICSTTELGLPKINDGIMILDDSIGELTVGKELKEYPQLNDDIFEVDLTPNRGDCLSVHGIARDLSAALDIPLKEKESYIDADGLLGIGRLVSIHADEKLNSSFAYRAFDISGKLNLDIIKLLRLAISTEIKASAIENLLNYTTLSTGVLFRAYDFHKICPSCEKILLDIEKETSGQYGVYYNGICLSYAGIMQNNNALVDKDTKTVLIEANYTDPTLISQAVGENKSFTPNEHIYRSSRGSEPNLSLGYDFLFKMLSKIKTLSLYAGTQQVIANKQPNLVSFTQIEINNLIGHEIPRNDIVKILKKLAFEVAVEQDLINVKIPLFRHDIVNSHDVCEEIVRIVGIDNIPSKALNFSEKNRLNSTFYAYNNAKKLRLKASSNGFFECVHYVFDSTKDLDELGFKPCEVEILNPINNDLNTLRPTLINHLLRSCERNIKNSKRSVKLFEIGSVFDIAAKESNNIAFVVSGLKNEATLLNGAKPENIDFLYVVSMVQNVIGKFKCQIPQNKISYLSEFEQANIIQNNRIIGHIGRLDIRLEAKRDLLKTYICEIKMEHLNFKKVEVQSYSKFPSISRDLSILIPNNMSYEEIRECIIRQKIKDLKEFFPVDIYKDENLKDCASLTIKLIFQNMQKTLEDDDIAVYVDKILVTLKDSLGLSLR